MGFGARQLFLHHYAYLLASMVPTMLITDSSSETKPQLIGHGVSSCNRILRQ